MDSLKQYLRSEWEEGQTEFLLRVCAATKETLLVRLAPIESGPKERAIVTIHCGEGTEVEI